MFTDSFHAKVVTVTLINSLLNSRDNILHKNVVEINTCYIRVGMSTPNQCKNTGRRNMTPLFFGVFSGFCCCYDNTHMSISAQRRYQNTKAVFNYSFQRRGRSTRVANYRGRGCYPCVILSRTRSQFILN